MHWRRLAALLIGAWLAGSLFMIAVATHNLRSVDDLLKESPRAAAEVLSKLGQPHARSLLRFQAAELNRWYFTVWEWCQLVLGVGLLITLVLSRRRSPVAAALCLLMLAATLAMRTFLTPAIIDLGRALDFMPATQPSPTRDRFWTLHSAYSIIEVIKLVCGLVLAAILVLRAHHSSDSREPARLPEQQVPSSR